MNVRRLYGLGLLCFVVGMLVPAVQAADVEKKFRVSLSVGGINGIDSIESNAGNQLRIRDPQTLQLERLFLDPRNDSAVFGELDIQAGALAMAQVQYAVTKTIIIEGSIGYAKNDVGDIDVQAQFDGQVFDEQVQEFDFRAFRVPAGEMERIPVAFTVLGRFRPRSNFNPYIGGGIGYSFVGFEPTPEFDQLSTRLDSSQGAQTILTDTLQGFATASSLAEAVRDLSGATVDARDTFEWHLLLGAEYGLKNNWSIYAEVRQVYTSRALEFRFDGQFELGTSVPNFEDFLNSSNDSPPRVYGPLDISTGGLVDAGSLQPAEGQPVSTDCTATPELCAFSFDAPDGELDTGLYYIQGGPISMDVLTAQFGLRYTF